MDRDPRITDAGPIAGPILHPGPAAAAGSLRKSLSAPTDRCDPKCTAGLAPGTVPAANPGLLQEK